MRPGVLLAILVLCTALVIAGCAGKGRGLPLILSDDKDPTSTPWPREVVVVTSIPPPSPTATSAPVPTASPDVRPTPTLLPTRILASTPTPPGLPNPTPSQTLFPVPTSEPPAIVLASTPTPVPTDIPTPAPTAPQTHAGFTVDELREFMLAVVNERREDANLPPLSLGSNPASQSHAEDMLSVGFNSHWGSDGRKPGMRYTQAGGYQHNQENVYRGRCGRGCVFDPEAAIREAVDWWVGSPGHRKEILRPTHRLLNVGLAWESDTLSGYYVFHAVQQFEGDYVRYSSPPAIDRSGHLTMTGSLANGAVLSKNKDLIVQVYYDPLPQPATLGQLQRVYGSALGLYVAKIRPPLSGRRFYTTETGIVENEVALGPHDFPTDIAPAKDWDEEKALARASRAAPEKRVDSTRHRITAERWKVDGADNSFDVAADFGVVLDEYGAGVYEVAVWALVKGEVVMVSEVSLFYRGGG